MNAAVYLRVSTDKQDYSNQEPECLALCARRGWTPVTYTEVGSGAKHRAIWERVLADARRGHVGAVVVWSLDRMGRTMLGILDAVREFDSRGIYVQTVMEPWISSTFEVPALRTLMISAFSFAAELERGRTIDRIHRGIHTARARGVTLGRPRALDGKGLQLLLDLRADGRKWCDIAVILAASGYSRPCGNPLALSTIQMTYRHVVGPTPKSDAVKGNLDRAFAPGNTGVTDDPRQVPLFT